MVDSRQSPVLSSPHLVFPLKQLSPSRLAKVLCTAAFDDTLTVYFSEAPDTLPSASSVPLPPYPSLKHLYVHCPSEDPFYPLLDFRLALQSAEVPLLTHLTLSNISLDCILALRWGSFTSFGDSAWPSARVWRGLKYLDLKLLPPRQDHSPRINESPAKAQERHQSEKQEWRTGLKILHDWLNSFASTGNTTPGGLETLKIEWLNHEGPNPLLLDIEVGEDGKSPCTSAPAIMWNRLENIWLRGVHIGAWDVENIKQRAARLELLMVQPKCLENKILGWETEIDGYKWWKVYLGERISPKKGEYAVLGAVEEGAEDAPESSRARKDSVEYGVPLTKEVSASSMDVTIMLAGPFPGVM